MTQPTIQERRDRVASALHNYVLHDKRSHPCEAAEVLCDLMHWLDAEDLDIDDKIYQARTIYEQEVQAAERAAECCGRTLISPDVLCELAHELTVRECRIRGVTVDARIADDHDGETLYTDEAQSVFEAIYDIVSAVLDPYCEKGGAQ